MSTPFRWDISRREQLGALANASQTRLTPEPDFLDALRQTAAQVVAFFGVSDLAFIGRTPENLFDYLSGMFQDIPNTPDLHLIQFSLRWAGEGGVKAIASDRLEGLFEYFRAEGLSPKALSQSPRRTAFVDFVAYGGTLQNLFALLKLMAERDQVDWNAAQRRLMIVGITTRTKNSPKTWRWQQNQDWLHLIPDTEIKNVSAPGFFTYYIANEQPKLTYSHHPAHWAVARQNPQGPSEAQLQALEHALALFNRGRVERAEFAARLSKTDRMKEKAVRDLVLALKGHG